MTLPQSVRDAALAAAKRIDHELFDMVCAERDELQSKLDDQIGQWIKAKDEANVFRRKLEVAVEALKWIAGKDDSKPYVTYYERYLDDDITVPTYDTVAEEALAKIAGGADGK